MPDLPELFMSGYAEERLRKLVPHPLPSPPKPDTGRAMRPAAVPITVVMPVYNAVPWLDAAVKSVLAQTHSQFRLAIYDDHSTDDSYEAALAWAERDPRISVTRGAARLGPSASSNAAARLAQTEFVARMDADDIAAAERLTLQLKALAEHPDAVLVGSTFDMIDGAGRVIRRASLGRTDGIAPPFAHPSIAYRRAAFEAAGGYREGTDYFEDVDLFRRMARLGALLVIDHGLLGLRFAGQHARLRDAREEVLGRINRHYHDPGVATGPGRTLAPMAFYSVAVLAILARERPRLLGLMARRVHLAHPLRVLGVAGIVALAELSPSLARALSQLAATVREALTRHGAGDGAVHVWTPRLP